MELFKHQANALERGKDGNLALFHACGTGKTCTALCLIRYWLGFGGKALVVCPLSIIDAAWLADAKKFTPDLRIASLWSKDPAKRLEQLNGSADVHVVNFEGLRTMYGVLAAQKYTVLIVDESSKLKNWRSQITRALLSFAGVTFKGSPYRTDHIIPHRYCLSGTPAPNGEEEYWSQIQFVAPNQVFSANYYAFRGRYFAAQPMRFGAKSFKKWIFRGDRKLEFMQRMKVVADVVRKEDAVDLPDQVHEVRQVTLAEGEAEAYRSMKKTLACQLSETQIVAPTVMAEIMKLRQITSGFAYGSDGSAMHIGRSKLNELLEVLEEVGNEQVLIWANFIEEISFLAKTLKAPALYSQTVDREQAIKDFQEGRSQYLIANPQSAGHGLTFVNCSYCVYFSLNYSLELWQQSQDRIHRIGQTNNCTYFYLLAKGTIDEVIYAALQQKRDLSEAVLSYLRSRV